MSSAPRVDISYPDNRHRKDRKAAARGEIPVLMMNVNLLKDKLDGMVAGPEGAGSFLMPDWFADDVFLEMMSEIRSPKGWENKSRRRNEAWDLATYAIAACIHLGVEKINWDSPPKWAAPWRDNSFVQINQIDPEVGYAKVFATDEAHTYDLSKLGSVLG
jgi:phage terminase large subunit GpA-like protein